MSLTKKVQGDYNINTVDADGNVDNVVTITTSSLNVAGNLVVQGTSTHVESTDLYITDKTILLNKGETGAGITGTNAYSGIEVDRGPDTDRVGLRYEESTNKWRITNDGTTWANILAGASIGIENVVEDLSPQLGGPLDVNGQTITSASNGDIILDPNGTGQLKINHEVSLQEQGSDPSSTFEYNKLYSKTPGEGGTGLYFVNTSSSDELVSKTKAMVYGLIL